MPREPKKIPAIIIYDWETGGLSHQKNPVTEFAAIALHGTTLEEILRYDNLIKPYDVNLIYESKAAELTGITKEKCEKEGVPLRELVTDICTLFEEANVYKSKNFKPYLVAHNSGFDTPFLQDVFRRAKVDLSKYLHGYTDPWGNFQPYNDDTVIEAKKLFAEVTDNDTKFNLESVCTKAGISVTDSHRAMNDCEVLADFVRYYLTRLRSGSSEVTITEGKASVHRSTFEW